MASLAVSREAPKVDPNHLQTGGYGYLIHESRDCSVWWAEGAYKVMRDAPTPTAKDGKVKMWSAKTSTSRLYWW